MKKIKNVFMLVFLFCLVFYKTCLADVVWIDPDSGEFYGGKVNNSPLHYILIGLLVLSIVICSVIIIRKVIKKKK